MKQVSSTCCETKHQLRPHEKRTMPMQRKHYRHYQHCRQSSATLLSYTLGMIHSTACLLTG